MAFLPACSSGDPPSSEETAGSARAAYGDYVLEHQRWESTFVECLTDAGLAPKALSDSSWEGFSVPNRPSSGGLDSACLVVAGPVPVNPPFDRGMLEDVYESELRSADCLREHGYPVAEPSSREAFVEGHDSEAGPPWLAHSEVVHAVNTWEWYNEVLPACPQTDPWGLFAPEEFTSDEG